MNKTLKAFLDEMEVNAVLSKDYKARLNTLALGIASEAYDRGFNKGKDYARRK